MLNFIPYYGILSYIILFCKRLLYIGSGFLHSSMINPWPCIRHTTLISEIISRCPRHDEGRIPLGIRPRPCSTLHDALSSDSRPNAHPVWRFRRESHFTRLEKNVVPTCKLKVEVSGRSWSLEPRTRTQRKTQYFRINVYYLNKCIYYLNLCVSRGSIPNSREKKNLFYVKLCVE